MEERKEGSKSGGRDEWRPDRVRTFVFDSSILHSATKLDSGPEESRGEKGKRLNLSERKMFGHSNLCTRSHLGQIEFSYRFGPRWETVEPVQQQQKRQPSTQAAALGGGRSPMMITALAAVARAKKAAEALLARCSEKLFFFDGTFGKRKRRRRGRKEKELAAHPKAAFPPSLPRSPRPRLSSPRLLLSLCWSQQKQHCSTEKAKTYTCCMEPSEEAEKKDRSTQTPPLSLPRYSLSRRLFDSPEREENYGKNETEGKNDEGEGGRGESRTGKHRTR